MRRATRTANWLTSLVVASGCSQAPPAATDAGAPPAQNAAPRVDRPAPVPPAKTPQPANTGGPLRPTRTVPLDVQDVLAISLSPDGGTLGLAGRARPAGGAELEHLSVFFDLSTGKRTGVPIKLDGPGAIASGGKATAYADGSKVVVHELATGAATEAAQISSTEGRFSFAPDGRLLVTASKTKLAFLPWPADGSRPLEVETPAPVLGLSRVYLQGTRVAAVHGDAGEAVLRVWDAKTGKPLETVPLGRPKLARDPVQVAEDGRAMIVTGPSGREALWDLGEKRQAEWAGAKLRTGLTPLAGGRVLYTEAEVKVTGGQVASAMVVVVADLRTGEAVHKLAIPPGVESFVSIYVAASLDGRRVVLVSDDSHMAYIWDLP
ncbi:WD40 repeat domain-containing protein [Gemmata sp.]|uniref:WD40 repeat domain-containing protein n=1 Tax=Gemmata sp. TaxID=1914242 RepID=UPI003F70243E